MPLDAKIEGLRLPRGWSTRRLSDVCEIEKCTGAHQGLPYVGLEEIESGTARFLGSFDPRRVQSFTFRFTHEHVLYGRLRPYLNKALAPDFEGHCSTEIFPLRPGPGLLRHFLLYWLLFSRTVAQINSTCTGARMPRANMHAVMDFPFILPPLAEQKRIVAILDEAFTGIDATVANAEKNLANARELFESDREAILFHTDKEWAVRRVRDLGRVQTGTTPKTSESENYGGSIPFIKPGDFLRDGSLNYTNACLSALGASRGRLISSGSVLMVCIGATIGKTGVAERQVSANQQINVLTPERGVSSRFVYHQMTTRFFQLAVRAAAGQATLPIINKSKWSNLRLRIPPEPEQVAIASRLDSLWNAVNAIEVNLQRKLDALAELKQSILQKAFAGELTAKEAEREMAAA